MFKMFNQLFNALTTLFSAAEKAAKSLDNLASIGEEMSGAYADEQRVLRQAKLAQLAKDNKLKVA